MIGACDPHVASEETIPDGENGPVIGVRLRRRQGMMNAVHVGRDEERLYPALEPLGQGDIAVLDRFGGEDDRAVARHHEQGNVENKDGEPIDEGGEDVFEGMVAQRCRHIDVRVRMMERVNPPQQRHGMLTAMHRVAQQIEEEKARDEAQRHVGNGPRWEVQAQRRKRRAERRGRAKQKSDEKNVRNPDADIAEAASQGRKLSPPPRPHKLPASYQENARRGDDESQVRLLPDEVRASPVIGRQPPSPAAPTGTSLTPLRWRGRRRQPAVASDHPL